MGQLLIDEQLIFDEDNFLLFRADATDEEPLRLGAIASRCLAMLLRSDGAVVRKRELMAGAWGQFGLEVTDNSLAQVVRQLRLALEKLQPDREFIQTLPRIGYKLADGVKVEELSSVENTALATYVVDACDETPASEAPLVSNIPDTEGDSVGPTSNLAGEAVSAVESKLRQAALKVMPRRWGLWLALPLWGICILLGSLWLVPPPDLVPPRFATEVAMNDVYVHHSVPDLHPLAAPYLESLVLRSRKLGVMLGMSTANMHLYLLPAPRGANQILCDGELETASSRCIGVQQHD